jgi:Tol biopolymer transport system component
MRPIHLTLLLLSACAAPATPPIPGVAPVDHLIRAGETHFVHLWQLTDGGQNAEAYWSFAGDRLTWQAREDSTTETTCDAIYITGPDGAPQQISNGHGTTTCAYFLPDDTQLLYASTHAAHTTCPDRPSHERGYVWPLHPEFDIYIQDLATGTERLLIAGPGYDAEATVSPTGDRIVFTSTRSGDIELWTCDLNGGALHQVTDTLGYDGGAFFSHDGTKLVYRSTEFTSEEDKREYQETLARDQVRPGRMELYTIHADGTNRQQITQLGQANFAPYFHPSDEKILFSSNHTWSGTGPINFDLYLIDTTGQNLERITYEDSFDCFPMFSHNGRYLAFSSNRGNKQLGETNVFIAEWRD